jgi:nicotinate phosphoribosyltransferase
MKNFTITGIYTDLYQLSMAQVYYLKGKSEEEAVFDYFFRKIPFDGGYTVFAGLGDLLPVLRDLIFTRDDIEFLRGIGFDDRFLKYLENFRFGATLFSMNEGEVVFPNEPIIQVHGRIVEAQLAETVLLNILNFESLIATKAARMRSVAENRILTDFGLRRAQGIGGYHATRAAIIGGFNSTSNVKAARDFSIPAVGTMAHSFIQSYDSELQAFRDFSEMRPENCVLLVDTYDTLKSGIPNAITIAKEMEPKNHRLSGIRLDSGDLAYLSKQARIMLDNAGLQYVKITVSNQLNEYVIKSLMDQQAPIDVFGVGTSLVTGPPDAALDGVYKLAYAYGKPRIKLSENLKKMTLPGKKQVYRMINGAGSFFGADVITFQHENEQPIMHHPFEVDKSLPLGDFKQTKMLHKVMERGQIVGDFPGLAAVARYCHDQIGRLPQEFKRFEYPHLYKVGISEKMRKERNLLKSEFTKP